MIRTAGKHFSSDMDWTDDVLEQFRSVLVYAANTGDVIDWGKLRDRLESAPPPITDHEFCGLIVDAANGRKLSGQQWNQLVGLQVQIGVDRASLPLTDYARAGLTSVLAIIADGTEKQRSALENEAAKTASASLLICPVWSRGGRRDRIVATGISGAIAYGLLLLSDQSGQFAGTLCRCQYSKCGKFFFKHTSGRGAPKRRYCTKRHGELGDGEKARERMRKSRR